MVQTRKNFILFGCVILLLVPIAGCWIAWYTVLTRHRNQMFGQIRQQQAPASMCWGISADGTVIRQTTAAPPPFVTKVETTATYRAHKFPVSAVSCALDAIASADEGGTVRIWGLDGNTFNTLTIKCQSRSTCALRTVAWKPGESIYLKGLTQNTLLSEKYIAVGGNSDQVQVVSVSDGKVAARYTLPPSTMVTCIQWSSDGKYLAAGGYNRETGRGLVRVWNDHTRQKVSTYWGHLQRVNALAWSPDRQRIASASDDATVQIWQATTGKRLFTYRGHTRKVNTVSWVVASSGQRLIVSGSDDRTVQVWDAETGQLSFTHVQAQAIVSVTWDPSYVWLASGSRDGVIDYYWGVENPLFLPGL